MDSITIGNVTVSRLLLGSNPFSGFSHQGVERDHEMVHYYSTQQIKETLTQAEALGVTGLIARTDHHVMRFLIEHRDEGGGLQWFAQTCPEVASTERCADRAASLKAKACHIHGGVMDNLVAQGNGDEARRGVAYIRDQGLLAGVAGHTVQTIRWAADNLDVDYFMCCYYNPTPRDDNPEHVHGCREQYLPEDREAMTALIQQLPKPAIHYKVMAAGRNDPGEALAYCRSKMRADDLVCIGVYRGDNPDMLADDVAMF